ncbi:SlyX family protein [Chitinibacteraceae bacterium HSL-7]
MDHLEERITELEIRLALTDQLVETLNTLVAEQSQQLMLQQAQLREIYRQLQDQRSQPGGMPAHEVPPHY